MNENTENNMPKETVEQLANATTTSIPKTKFVIELYDEILGDDDKITYRKVHSDEPLTFEATTKSEVENYIAQFKMCGQRAKIIKVIPPTGVQPKPTLPSQPLEQSKIVLHLANFTPLVVSQSQSVQQKPIRYYKVGDIDIKDDNGKLYQKQWMRLSDSEASNLRVINDKNNQLVNITGKHFEMKKWILVENTNSDDSTNLEDNLK